MLWNKNVRLHDLCWKPLLKRRLTSTFRQLNEATSCSWRDAACRDGQYGNSMDRCSWGMSCICLSSSLLLLLSAPWFLWLFMSMFIIVYHHCDDYHHTIMFIAVWPHYDHYYHIIHGCRKQKSTRNLSMKLKASHIDSGGSKGMTLLMKQQWFMSSSTIILYNIVNIIE